MKLFVNGRFVSRRMTGVDRFAFELLVALDEMMLRKEPMVAGISVTLLVPADVHVDHRFSCVEVKRAGHGHGQRWEQSILPRHLPKDGLLLNLCNTGPVWCKNQVTVIHDAATARVPQAFSRSFRWWYGILMPLLGRRSRRIVTVSEFSRNEIIKAYAIPEKKIDVVTEGGEHILRVPLEPKSLERFGLGKRPFVLAVSSMAAHKNFRLVLDALATLPDAPFDVAIAGGANPKVFGAAEKLRSDRVMWLGYVSDAELRMLYQEAMCFVFPSIYEGFGIPPLEAMHCGCPVLAAFAASIPEVCGDAALYFDPNDSAQLARLLMQVAEDADLRATMVNRGYSRASQLSWKSGALQVLASCRRAAV